MWVNYHYLIYTNMNFRRPYREEVTVNAHSDMVMVLDPIPLGSRPYMVLKNKILTYYSDRFITFYNWSYLNHIGGHSLRDMWVKNKLCQFPGNKRVKIKAVVWCTHRPTYTQHRAWCSLTCVLFFISKW